MDDRASNQTGGRQQAAFSAPPCPAARNGRGRRRRYRNVASLLAMLAGLLAGAQAEPAGAPRGIVPLTAVKAFDLQALGAFCAGLPVPCSAGDTRVYTGGKAADDVLWLIDAARPALVRWDRATGKAEQWNFSGHHHSYAEGGEQLEAGPLILHPALYPAPGGRFSVALVREQREMYSGGGASFGVADFVAAEPGGGVGSVLYAAVPFACQKMIRACFSEREYRTSKHCHDESIGYLTIAIPAGADWQFTWHEREWPAHTPARDSVKSKVRFKVPQGGASGGGVLPTEPAFCGGPM